MIIMGSFAMLLPAIMYVLENMGVSTGFSTPVIAAYSLAQFISGPQWGRLSDRIGRKRALCFALTGSTISFLIMALFASEVWVLFITMVMAGFFSGALAVVFAAVSDITTQENRTRGMGILGAGIGLSFVIGTAIGGSVAGDTAATASILGPAFAASIACFSGFMVILLFFKETYKPSQHTEAADLPSSQLSRFAAFQSVARHSGLLKLSFLILAFTFSLALMEPLVPKYIKVHFGWGPVEMRNIFIFMGLTIAITQGGLVGPLARRFGEYKLVTTGLGLMAFGLIMLASIPQEIFIIIALTLTGLGTALFNASALSMAATQAQAHERGAVMGVVQSMQSLGRSFGPMLTGFLFDLSWAIPFWLGGGILLISVFWFSTLSKPEHERKQASS
jgi:MFS family permease